MINSISRRGVSRPVLDFFWKMKDINRTREPQGVDCAKRIAAKVLDYFHYSRSAKAAQRLCIAVLAAALRDVQGVAHVILNWLGKGAQILAT